MTLLGDALTNVHLIEGVLFVQWVLYVLDQPQAQDGAGDDDHSDASSEEEQDSGGKVFEALIELRKAGFIALEDVAESSIWVFELPTSLKESKLSRPDGSDWDFSDYLSTTKLSPVMIDINWFPSGILVIRVHSRLRSRTLYRYTPIDELKPKGQVPVIVAPFGTPGTVNRSASADETFTPDLKTKADPSHSRWDPWKTKALTFLKSRGIVVCSYETWHFVKLSDDTLHGHLASFTEVGSRILLWPGCVCLIDTSSLPLRNLDLSWAWDTPTRKGADPLAEAQEWYLNPDVRRQAEEEGRKKQRKESMEKPTSPIHAITEDIVLDRFQPRRQQKFLDPQAASAIYPTPPDGSRLVGPGTTSIGASPADQRLFNDTPGGKIDDVAGATQELDLSAETPQASVGIDSVGDDLFEDMGADMFAADGLTDADFNFFDENDEVTNEDKPELDSGTQQQFSSEELNTKIHETEKLPEWDILKDKPLVEDSDQNDILDVAMHEDQDAILTYEESVPLQQQPQSIMQESPPVAVALAPQYGTPQGPEKSITFPGSLIHHASSYDEVDLPPLQPDNKYGQTGKFASNVEDKSPEGDKKHKQSLSREIPRLGLLETRQQRSQSTDSESTSDAESYYLPFATVNSPEASTLKRKRPGSDDGDPDRAEDYGGLGSSLDTGDFPTLSNLARKAGSLSLEEDKGILTQSVAYRCHGAELVGLAQLLVEQATFRSSYDADMPHIGAKMDVPLAEPELVEQYDSLSEVLPSIFAKSENCILKTCIAPLEVNVSAPANLKAAPKPPQRVVGKTMDHASQSIEEIPPPMILAKRTESLMEFTSIAMHFWEELGLKPCLGPKNVRAVIIVPKGAQIEAGAEAFLGSMNGAYQSMNLGNHTALTEIEKYPKGVMTVPFEDEWTECLDRLRMSCRELGPSIAQISIKEHYVVVYIANPFGILDAFPQVCSSFLALKNSCEDPLLEHDVTMVLKIIPISMVASKTTIAAPTPATLRQVAKDVYDNCKAIFVSDVVKDVDYLSPSLVHLAAEIPKKVEFRLSSDSYSPLLEPDACLHVAYSYADRGPWLSMAITNARGSKQWQASYIVDQVEPLGHLQTLFTEILEIVLEMMGSVRVPHRIMIAKDAPMEEDEAQLWISIFSASAPNHHTLFLLSVDLDPALYLTIPLGQLHPPLAEALPKPQEAQANMGNSPATPTAAGNPSSSSSVPQVLSLPLENNTIDPNLRLIDALDTVYSVLNYIPLDQDSQPSSLSSTAARGTGLLVKRAGIRPSRSLQYDQEGFECISVSFVWPESTSDAQLRDVLKMYRGLGSVAKARGVVGRGGKGLWPWHLAVAREGRRILEMCLGWEEGAS
ncbi:mediator of RNA polymerase II transcription subunit 13 [Agyrium rufum]|nr:mediator of RNA polymerase II transcription subunit 13 [Agyrium rufum]